MIPRQAVSGISTVPLDSPLDEKVYGVTVRQSPLHRPNLKEFTMANSQTMSTVTLAVEGMSCGNCVRHINEAMDKHFAGLTADVDLEHHTMTVTFDPETVSLTDIAAVMAEEGYPVRPT
jgi:copper chaperone CopZ